MFLFNSSVLLKENAPGRAAPHRSPDLGCTKTNIFNEIHCKINKSGKQHQINHINYPRFLNLLNAIQLT